MALETISTLGVIVDPAVRARFDQTALQISSKYDYIGLGWGEFEPNVPAAKLNSVSGVGAATLTTEGVTYGSNNRYEGYAITQALRKYTSDISYTEETVHWLMKNDSLQIRQFTSMVDGAVNALQHSVDLDVAKMYYLGHGTTFFTGGDGLSVFNSAHTTRKPGAATQRNIFDTADGHLALSPAAITKAVIKLDRYKDNADVQVLPARDLTLAVPLELEALAHKILYSDYGPDTANLGVNESSEKGLKNRMRSMKVKTLAYIPSATYNTYWFLQDNQRAKDMALIAWGWKPRLKDESQYRNGTFYNEGSVYFQPLIVDWKAFFGSKGDASAS